MRLAEKLVKTLILIVRPPQTFRDKLRPPPNVNLLVWYILIVKRFFDVGLAQTNLFKYALASIGFARQSVEETIWLFTGYGFFCIGLGFYLHLWGIVETEIEISNRFNDFIEEMRNMKKNIEK